MSPNRFDTPSRASKDIELDGFLLVAPARYYRDVGAASRGSRSGDAWLAGRVADRRANRKGRSERLETALRPALPVFDVLGPLNHAGHLSADFTLIRPKLVFSGFASGSADCSMHAASS